MAMKAVLDSLDGVNEAFHGEYKKGDDGKYHLDVEGGEDTGALKRAKEHEKKERQRVEKELKEATERSATLQQELDDLHAGAVPKGDVDKLRKSYDERYAKREKELSDSLESANSTIRTLLVDNVATGLAGKLAAKPEFVDVLLPHIQSRLVVEKVDGKSVTRVKDKDGTVGALTVDDLEKELLSNKSFAPILRGNRASGGGATNSDDRGGSATGRSSKDFNMATATPKEIVAHRRAQSGG